MRSPGIAIGAVLALALVWVPLARAAVSVEARLSSYSIETDGTVQLLVEVGAVGQLREAVVVGVVVELGLGAAARGHVLRLHDQVLRLDLPVARKREGERHPHVGAIPVAAAHLELGAGDHTFVARLDPTTNARPMNEMAVYFDMSHFHLFDAETGVSLARQ